MKLPFANLARAARVPIKHKSNATPSDLDYARHFGVDRQTIARWTKDGLPWQQADRLAVTYAGVHPGSIWPEWWDLA